MKCEVVSDVKVEAVVEDVEVVPIAKVVAPDEQVDAAQDVEDKGALEHICDAVLTFSERLTALNPSLRGG